ncbi:MAG: DUF2520 domain-containing protein [Solirubrobacterales bacterium]|nr:DUF2520 domain-containing protein [Solirubrobacterales bacterium]
MIVGRGRVGRSIAAAAASAELEPVLRAGDDLEGLAGRAVLLCVPDQAIASVAAGIGAAGSPPSLIGHTSGATGLEALEAAGAEQSFSLHPLQTIPDGETDLAGCPAAVAATAPATLEAVTDLATTLGMTPFRVAEADRATYHAAASIASNFLVTVEQTAAELLDGIGIDRPREVLAPLVRRSLENWLERGPAALTGPIARGDEVTVGAHREALRDHPELLDLYDGLAARTRELAATGSPR